MDRKGRAFFQALAQRHPPSIHNALLQKLPSSENFTPFSVADTSLSFLASPEEWIKKIHYSWFLSLFPTLSPTIQSLYLNLLPPPVSQKISSLLKISIKKTYINPVIGVFLLSLLKEKIKEKEILDFSLLPLSPLNALLQLKKEELVLLIDLLGIYDLSYTLRSVIDKQLLARVLDALSPAQRSFLSLCNLHSTKEKVPFLNLKQWNGDKKYLREMIHRRGLHRLATGISQEDPSFLWHLTHLLDTGRAKVVHAHFLPPPSSTLVELHKKQILNLLKRFKKES